ncbi:MAG: PKD domain-containing protein [Bacteroidetes bacterium]|nr:PKD domain-containing protein [Bacteroidota bacterium]
MKHLSNISTALILTSILFLNACKKTESVLPPVACFTPSATIVASGTAINFTNCTNAGTSYFWDFGDGTTSTDASPNHTYTGSGTYTVTMTATNADGTNTKTSYITVTGVGGGCVKTVVEVDNTPISSPTTWDSCHIYHITNSVGLTATLTIEAGTVVKFDALKGINVNS